MKTAEQPDHTTTDHRTIMVRDLLTDYAGWLLGCGATMHQAEKNLKTHSRRLRTGWWRSPYRRIMSTYI